MPRKQYTHLIIGVTVILVALIILAVRLGQRETQPEDTEPNTLAGVSYLQALEAKDPEQVVSQLKAIRQQRLMDLREERMRQLESGEISVWSLFEDYVLLGDSRAVGFSFYEFLSADRVLAESGAKLYALEEHIPDLVKINPANLFLCYGLNDVAGNYFESPDAYAQKYTEIIREIQKELPDVKIYISSILPAKDPAFDTFPSLVEIPEYTAAVEQVCKNTGCYYVDNTAICEQYADLWEPDGIHMARAFYSHWAANMITEVYSSGLDWDDTDAEDSAEAS